MDRLSDAAIEIINALHRERIDYNSEYLPLIDAMNRLSAYEDTGVEPGDILSSVELAKVACALHELNAYKNLGSADHFRELLEAEQNKSSETNADRIRGMSDEELAWELMTWRCEAVAKHHGVESQYPDTQKTILSWLQKQRKENEHGQAYFAGKDNP